MTDFCLSKEVNLNSRSYSRYSRYSRYSLYSRTQPNQSTCSTQPNHATHATHASSSTYSYTLIHIILQVLTNIPQQRALLVGRNLHQCLLHTLLHIYKNKYIYINQSWEETFIIHTLLHIYKKNLKNQSWNEIFIFHT